MKTLLDSCTITSAIATVASCVIDEPLLPQCNKGEQLERNNFYFSSLVLYYSIKRKEKPQKFHYYCINIISNKFHLREIIRRK